jgi:hypothetical protein
VLDEQDGPLLMNCPKCEDVLRGVEGHTRRCFCGACSITVDGDSRVTVEPAELVRVIRIPWGDYDGARPGCRGSWSMLEDVKGAVL